MSSIRTKDLGLGVLGALFKGQKRKTKKEKKRRGEAERLNEPLARQLGLAQRSLLGNTAPPTNNQTTLLGG